MFGSNNISDTTVSVCGDGDYISLYHSGQLKRFHAVWLRDNAPDPDTRSATNGQRLITLDDIPLDTRVSLTDLKDHSVVITFEPEGKSVEFDTDWLLANAYDNEPPAGVGWLDSTVCLWDASLADNLPCADLAVLQSDPVQLRDWLAGVATYGVGKLHGGAVRSGALFDVVDLFGYVRETNYGRHFEVRTEINPNNLAFTGLGLQAHTDNPYRDPVPTLQILYCLENSASGGENMVVDGFAVAGRLQQENAQWFDVLSRHCANFEYSGADGVRLRCSKPVIELDAEGRLSGVRFNNRSAAALTSVPFDEMPLYYNAWRRMAELIDDPSMEVSFKLEPGECFIVDNTRVLHARKAYDGSGTRWLQGCYADKDSLLSRLATLRVS